MTTTLEKIRALSPCPEGLARAVECGTLREWWDTSTTRSDMTWLVGKAHSRGTLPRRRLVRMAVRCCETVAHVMPPEALPLLADLSAWCGGADDIDLRQVHDALWTIRRTAAAYAYADAADAAADAADAADAAYAAADAAAAYAADAMCDVIRDEIDIDEVCAALGLDPDEVLA